MITNILAIICTKKSGDTNKYIAECINKINEHYNVDIVIVSSDDHEHDITHGVKDTNNIKNVTFYNKNEMGAYSIGYNKYPNYDVYMCIQDLYL